MVVGTVVSEDESPGFESAGQLGPFCEEFVCCLPASAQDILLGLLVIIIGLNV